MKKALAILLALTVAFGVIGCSHQKEITKDDIVDKVYVYEKAGFGGDFTIEIKADGTFSYYEGGLSSYFGIGNWSYSDGMLTLSKTDLRLNESDEFEDVTSLYNFLLEKDTLVFVANGSDNFLFVKVKDGEKFIAQ